MNKALIQVAPYLYKDLISCELLDVIVALATLCKCCYVGEISVQNLDLYAKLVEKAVLNFHSKLDSLPSHLRETITGRVKLHLLYHLPDCIRKFGPPFVFCTEKEESFNQKTRNVISCSNRRAYSLHTARRFVDFQALELLLNGAYFLHQKCWIDASNAVINFRSFLLQKKGIPKRRGRDSYVHGDRIITQTGFSTGVGGFVRYNDMNANISCIFRIVEIQKKPFALFANLCSELENRKDSFDNSIYEVHPQIIDVTSCTSQFWNVVNMQHVCTRLCKVGIGKRIAENTEVDCEKFIHSNEPFFSYNAFCFSQ